jgi:nucleoside-diphosphate-sugar epimerase
VSRRHFQPRRIAPGLAAGIGGVSGEFPTDRARIDIGSYYADDSAFRTASGWAPVTSLQDGVGRTLEWFRPRLGHYL